MQFPVFSETPTSGNVYPYVPLIEINVSSANPAVTIVVQNRIDIDGVPKTLDKTNKIVSIVTEQADPEDPPVNLAETFPIYDLATGQDTGTTMTYGELMTAVYGFVRKAVSG